MTRIEELEKEIKLAKELIELYEKLKILKSDIPYYPYPYPYYPYPCYDGISATK